LKNALSRADKLKNEIITIPPALSSSPIMNLGLEKKG
jgi:hypothetical protein